MAISLEMREANMNKGTTNEDKEIELLLEDLHHLDSDKRKMACLALGKAKAASAVDHRIEALSDQEMLVRQCAAEALGEIGDPKAVDPLINALPVSYTHLTLPTIYSV